MSGKNDDAEDDFSLFRRAMADSKRNRPKVHLRQRQSPPAIPTPRATEATPNPGVRIDETEDGPVLFARGGLQNKVIRKLKRGDYRYSEILDLHGHTTVEADDLLADFLSDAVNTGHHTVLIIHGKGLRSGQPGGVLKPYTLNWLKQQPEVKAFCSALPRDGGTGAVYVLLRVGRGR